MNSSRVRWWRVVRQIGLWTGAVVLALALVAAGLVFWSVRRAFPQHGGEIRFAGLSAPVTVYRDARGIPQIFARTAADLFTAQGYVHAQDRFWEMDLRRHVTAGRLSELFGADQVATDAFLRTMGWRRVAEQEWGMLAAETRAHLQEYANGVNAWIADNGGVKATGAKSLEYTLLGLSNDGYTVEPWHPVDSLAWLKAMAWDLRGNMASEIGRALLLAHGLDRQQVDRLYPAYPFDRNRPIIPGGAVVKGVFDASAEPPPVAAPAYGGVWPPARDWAPALDQLARAVDGLPLGDGGAGIGSNSWVIAGSHTTTGKPLLANDPHLSPSMPGIWYQMGLRCECEFNVAGFSFAGAPGIIIGHNNRIAWGFTNLGPDVTDLYLERLDGDRVLDGTQWVPLTTRSEVIRVAGGEPVTITVRSTRHGPLLSDRSGDLLAMGARPAIDPSGSPLPSVSPAPTPSLDPAAPGVARATTPYGVALRWTALDAGRTADAVTVLNRAADWSDFREAAALFEVPAQNMIYADVDGNIGYQSPGRIPIRGRGDGRWPVPGWDRAYDWAGYIPFASLPTVYNPAEGFIVTANQAVVGPRYAHLLTHDWSYGYRSQRILDLLRERMNAGKVGIEDIRRLQFDNRNGFAPTLVPVLLAAPADASLRAGNDAVGARVGAARDLLRDWDFQQPAESPPLTSAAAAFYNATWRHLLRRTFDELPADRMPGGDDRWWEVVRALLTEPGSPWWDSPGTPATEDMNATLALAMADAVAELTEQQGGDPRAWRWGRMHTLELRNATFGQSGIAAIEWLFNRGPAGTSGGDAIVNATGWSADEGYEVDAVPSMRMIVDMSNLDGSRWIQLTGNSGHAFHDNYVDQFDLWRTGANLPMRWDRPTIEAEATHTLTLRP